ncbi:glucose-1-phosphate adenylyltransferase [Georgenia sp. TF02-10]|uniref:glucose-1-phosphate adenylyltransferase family protein n=1 Tax=Georgenia sp. TF02-10 TaxID=2917725 RepID=UPI001FA76FC7|nr:sugar phosphate nucleotidyltransferase [Georgenia sp. TF02-10]UNX56282.1 glucose-1-phosphate adenylyltransferase [Georgenia sp. TF02-10]
MAPTRTLLVVLAGGAGGRLETLTDHRAKPALRFAGSHRLVDFPLAHAANSGIADAWVVEQFFPESINVHLAGGRPWDLDRTRGGLQLLGPHQGDEREGWHAGTADALWRKAEAVRADDPEVVLVASADAVYRMDYADVVAHHLASGAAVTMVTTRLGGDVSRYGVVQVSDGRITDYAYKPERPASDLVTTEVFAFRPDALLTTLEEVHRAHGAGPSGLGDLGDHVLPALVADGDAVEFRHDGYWRDVGTVPAYWQAHLDWLRDPPFDLDDPAWPIATRGLHSAAARVHAEAEVVDSLLAPGAVVEGTVRRSVVSPGAYVAPGAVVSESVLLDGVRVESGARVHRAVVDERARVGGRAQVGEDDDDAEVTLLGAGAVVPEDGRVPAGGRYPDPDAEPEADAEPDGDGRAHR